ncbi:MAG: bifunctional folylpolyglutamate synthase/dihydrofolate synthase [Polyangiaceae bacterium]|nr:bifunctional folylpolyglutamate synthase/dihydrofolate synthase [Polyangiaceae bacterium]
MSRTETLRAELARRVSRGAALGLGRVEAALAGLGHPERALTCIHVAGTNGKGSVCAMLEAMGLSAGLRTGLYSSPHLCRLNERIRIGGEPIADEPFADALEAALRSELTFFEALTVAAFVALREAAVELAIVEVGLGGRLDATNVLAAPAAAAVVSIDLDHTEWLGDDLRSIAAEKAAIFKPGAPAVVGPLAPEALDEARRRAVACGAGPLWEVVVGAPGATASPVTATPGARAGVVTPTARGVAVRGPGGRALDTDLALAGPHQVANAVVAVALAWAVQERLPGLARAAAPGLAGARWPGRLERIDRAGVTVWLDCAHNPAGARALAASLAGTLDPDRTVLLFGAMGDKAWPEMLDTLAPLARRRFYCEPLEASAGRRSAEPSALAARHAGATEPHPEHALARALAGCRPGDALVVCGSIFLVGAVRATLLGVTRDPPVPL